MNALRFVGGPLDGQQRPLPERELENFLVVPVPHLPEPVEYAGYQLEAEPSSNGYRHAHLYRFVGTVSRAELDWHGFFDEYAADAHERVDGTSQAFDGAHRLHDHI